MRNTDVSIRSSGRYLLSMLIVLWLFVAALPVMAQGPDEETGEAPDPTAKRAPQVESQGQAAPADVEVLATISEGFEAGAMPPAGWTHLQTNPNQTWRISTNGPHTGSYKAAVLYDPALVPQDEVLLSPTFSADYVMVRLWSNGSPYWCRDTYNNCDLEVWFVNGAWDWGLGDDVYLGRADYHWTDSWVWSQSGFGFIPASGNPARIALRYVGLDGAEISVDDVEISYFTCGDPHETNDTLGQATPISYGATLTDPQICPWGDEDYYAFAGNAGDLIVADIDAVSSGSLLDSFLYLYDTDGATILTSNDDYGSFDSYIEYPLPASGTYYLRVADWSSIGGGVDHYYTISLSNIGPLEYEGYGVDDDAFGESDGDDDGIFDPGESIELYVTLHNPGGSTATGVVATISTSDPHVTFLFNTSSGYPAISGGGTGDNADDFDLYVDPGTPDGHVIHFDLFITTSTGGAWWESFEVTVGQRSIYLPVILHN
jgi:hypothetical protein